MYLTFLRCLAVTFLLLTVNGLHAQDMLVVKEDEKTITFTTARGTTSQPDTITMQTGRYSGRYRVFFGGAGRHFFKVIAPTDKWIKMSKHSEVKLLVVFSPPASFQGETLADLQINAPAGIRARIYLKGTSTD